MAGFGLLQPVKRKNGYKPERVDKMVNLANLRSNIKQKAAEARLITTTAEVEARGLTAEERNKLDLLMGQIRQQQLELDEEELHQEEEGRSAVSVDSEGQPMQAAVKVAEGRSYRDMFGYTGKSNFRSFGEFLQVVNSQKYDARLDQRQFVSSQGTLGGFSVPVEHAGFLLDKSLEAEIVRPRAKVYPMKNSQLQIAKWNNNDHTQGLYGGLQGVWIGEGAVNNVQEGALELVTLEKRKLAIYTEISNELMYDSAVFEAEMNAALMRGIGWYLDDAFINGNNPDQPRGVFNDPALIPVARNNPGAVDYDDLANMFSTLYKGGRAVWMISDDQLPELMQLQDPGNHYVWQPNARDDVAGSLFGYPVVMSEKVPQGTILLVDWAHYVIGLGPDITLEKNNAPGWSRDVTSFRAIVRVDGVGSWSAPHTAANGNVYSWAVVLD